MSFVWISVRMLHDQSKDKLEKYYEDNRLLKCSYFDDLENKKIGENEILFFNWSSINKKDINLYVRENEQDNNLNSVIQNTKDEGRQIILVIDESHHTANSEKSKELIEIIGPKVTLEVSATPHLREYSRIVEVELERVKLEEMIKTEVAVNPALGEVKLGDKSTDELVLECALNKRKELLEGFRAESSNVNPLLLIQLPHKQKGLIDKKDEIVQLLKEKFGISEENGKLAIWLSDEKSDILPNVEKNENEVDVLIFKEAIAVGWDCPRASILVLFREWKSIEFSIQTVGRIMRMPEFRHYANTPELNKGYVFTNVAHMSIVEELAKDYLSVHESKRNNRLYEPIRLNSIHLKRQRERTRLSGEFTKLFIKAAEELGTKNVNTRPGALVREIMVDGNIVNIDKVVEDVAHEGTIGIRQIESELQHAFDLFIRSMCSPFAPADSSGRIKTAIYKFFEKGCKINDYFRVQKIVLSGENNEYFRKAITTAKEKYALSVVAALSEEKELEKYVWEVPLLREYTSRYAQKACQKSIMIPTFLKSASKIEEDFTDLIDGSQVKWWFKNGEGEKKFFAVLRTDGGAFYPDFVVQFKDGRIGLFDTKSGRTADTGDAGPRAEGLQKYIHEENKKGKKLWGGIVINVNGIWRYNDEAKYHYDLTNLSNWKMLDL